LHSLKPWLRKYWLRAVRAAFTMQVWISQFNRERFNLFPDLKQDIEVGVGIHSGRAITGFIGTSSRREYTAIGDCVNVSSRLCNEAKGGEVLISRPVADALMGNAKIGSWRMVYLKGRSCGTERTLQL
jgi:adenylate cyclase